MLTDIQRRWYHGFTVNTKFHAVQNLLSLVKASQSKLMVLWRPTYSYQLPYGKTIPAPFPRFHTILYIRKIVFYIFHILMNDFLSVYFLDTE